ncbi:MAG: DUF2269 family protein [Inquilinaceae bacterium]
MTTYDLVKWVHILSSTVLFGTGIGTAFHMWMTYRRGTARELALAGRNTVLADWLFTLPAGLVQPATGLWLVSIAGWRYTEPRLVATYALYGLAISC